MTVKITNPYVLHKLMREHGYKVRTETIEKNKTAQRALFALGFTWLHCGTELVTDIAGVRFDTDVSGENGYVCAFVDLESYEGRTRIFDNEETTIRALLGLAYGEEVVVKNDKFHATHKNANTDEHYLITHRENYYWSYSSQRWIESNYDADGLLDKNLIPLEDIVKEPVSRQEIEDHKPKTVFKGIW